MSGLEIHDLVVDYARKGQPPVRAVAGASVTVQRGQIVALVGESGCGKSTLARAAVGLLPVTAGSIQLDGEPVSEVGHRRRTSSLRRLQMIFQDPGASLNSRRRIGPQLLDGLQQRSARRDLGRAEELLERVGLRGELVRQFPHELSGGQRQRAAIARCLAAAPSVIVADEALSALDASSQAQITNLLRALADEYNVGFLFISHDLAVVRHIADSVSVMYLGKIVESGPADEVWETRAHPYTQALIAAHPEPTSVGRLPRPLPGDVPDPARPPHGCRLHPRCAYAFSRCEEEPPSAPVSESSAHRAACWLRIAEAPAATSRQTPRPLALQAPSKRPVVLSWLAGQSAPAFVLRRAVASAGLMLGVVAVVFLLVQVVPGNPVAANLGQIAGSDPAAVAAYRHRFGLDKPLPVQFVVYLKNVLTGDLGQSQQTFEPVATDLAAKIPATLEITIPAMIIAILVSIVLGVVAALHRNRPADLLVRIGSLIGISSPPFWLAFIAIYLFAFEVRLLPTGGRLSPQYEPPPKVTGLYSIDSLLAGDWSRFGDSLLHLVLPVAVLSAWAIGMLSRFVRAAVLEVLHQEYVRTARAKGLPEWTIIRRHVLRPALVSIVTVVGLVFAMLAAGTVLVERVFSWPGLGSYAASSTEGVDLPAIAGVTLFVACLYVGLNFLVDVSYGVIDPRMRTR